MPTTLVPTPSVTATGGLTKAKLREKVRHLVDQYGNDWLEDTNSSKWDINDALDEALTKWYEETRCSRGTYTLAATIGTDIYNRSSFPSGATRIFDLYRVTFNGTLLTPISVEQMDSINQNWRDESNSTPIYWMPWGDSEIRLYPTPDATSDIVIEGFQTPDLSQFNEDTEQPPGVNNVDHPAIAAWAAFLCIVGVPTDDNIARQPWLAQEWQARVNKAKFRAVGGANVPVILGRNKNRRHSRWIHSDTITP